jgi:hypothetical protein
VVRDSLPCKDLLVVFLSVDVLEAELVGFLGDGMVSSGKLFLESRLWNRVVKLGGGRTRTKQLWCLVEC